jgi:hypothetical protein
MPYIDAAKRPDIDRWVTDGIMHGIKFDDPGTLNYVIAQLLQATDPRCYEDYNKLIGVLECCKQEYYRRVVARYEEEKLEENGDVYP